jgi:hypothetical protein
MAKTSIVYYASPSSAPSTHPHVSYTSYPHSKDVNNFTGAHSFAGDGIANLEARIRGLETEVNDFKEQTRDFEREMRYFKTDIFFFGVSLTLYITYQFLTRSRSWL